MDRARSAGVTIGVLLASALACSGAGDSAATPPYALQARVGTYNDGSGRLGLALLATIREETGLGPDAPLAISIRDGDGALALASEYAASAEGSYLAVWRPEIAPKAGVYRVAAADSAGTLEVTPTLTSGSLALPEPTVTADGVRIAWVPVPDAAAYLCRVHTGGVLQLEAVTTEPECDVSSLPAGAYLASVLALSANLGAVAESSSMVPPLPMRFDVSEARVAFLRGEDGTSSIALHAAGGAYDDALGERSLAVWLSLISVGGGPVPEPWTIEVVGPGLPPSAPLAFTYPGNFARLLVWAPSVPATPGSYTLTATSATSVVASRFTVGEPGWLALPSGVVATAGAQGSARMSWDAVPGARSYLVSAYDQLTGTVAASQWVTGPSAQFPQATFAAGRAYAAYVAASDVDMVLPEIPVQVAVAENLFDFGSFVAR